MAIESTTLRKRLYVDGSWLDGEETLAVTDLADGGTVAEVVAAGPAEAEMALAAADRARADMRRTTIPKRADWLASIADGLEDRKPELADVIVREAGKPISSARGEVDAAAERYRRAAEEARHLRGEYREGTTRGHEGWEAVIKPEPVGVVLAITPYNYPLSTSALHVAPALAAGNAIIHKPASHTPVSSAILSEVIANIGLPDGAYNLVAGRGTEAGDLLAGDDRINAVAMTGSAAAGRHVARESGMVDLHMELGGNAPAIIFRDADLVTAAAACAKGALKYAGQRCSAISRVLAHEDVHDAVVGRIDAAMDDWHRGDLFDPSTDLGPLIDETQAEWVEELVEDALDRGARLERGGARDGRIFEPTLLAGVPHDARILHEEQFGPVAAVTTFADETEALTLANESDLALDGAVFTDDYDRARRVADAIDAGAVRINGAPSHGLGDIPFGGNKNSGIGREGIDASIDRFVRHKSIIL